MNKDRKIKMLSASAVALLALTGTVYGTESVSPTNESGTTSQETQNSTQEGTDNVESSAEDKAKEEAESKAEAESLAKEQEKIDEQSKLDAVTKEASKEEEVDETKVVPLGDLPMDEDTGLLDFAEYHKIAKGRALPRELTEEEEKEFTELVEEGRFKEIKEGVDVVEYELIRIYPDDYYVGEGVLQLRQDRLTEITSELMTLEEQTEYLANSEQIRKDLIEQGYEFDEDSGDFVAVPSDGETSSGISFDDLDDDTLYVPEPGINENPEQTNHYEEKDLYDNIGDYDSLTPDEFLEAYGASFIYRAEVPKGGYVQKEYALEDGTILAVETEHDEDTDTITMRWGVVTEVVKYPDNFEAESFRGRYNFRTNFSSDSGTYEPIEGEPDMRGIVLATGGVTLRDEGEYTPQKIYITYTEEETEESVGYLMLADAILEGEEPKSNSDLVGGVDLGLTDDVLHPEEPETPSEEEPETPGEEEPETPSEEEPETPDEEEPETPDEEEPETPNEEEPETPNEEDSDNAGNGSEDTGSGNESGSGDTGSGNASDGGESSAEGDNTGNESEDTGSGSGSGSGNASDGGESSTEDGESSAEDGSEESFQNTGASVLWGSILAGLGLGGFGTYLFKKRKKEDKDGDDEDDDNTPTT